MTERSPEYDRAMQRRGRIIATALMLVVTLPLAAAWFVYYTGIGMPTTQVNRGDLVSPPQLIDQLEPRELGTDGAWEIGTEERRRWRYVIPGYATCDQLCQDTLYLTRQVHIRLGKDAYRVERIYLLLDDHIDPALVDWLETEHPGLRVMRTEPQALAELLDRTNLRGVDPVASGEYFLMDQIGYLMMRYTPAHTGNELLDDVKRMLKVTYDE
ncbi:SCO family protein [Marinimicrobium alkaliphilum]|uniref:SCO family protein n=1 Tax=Marinimicrobium alkaliphilum TaxID=2202654 RepID=UPI000DB9BE43|nr:hypothetical protein [Marinimicrobium alkaliphilum]